MFSDEWKFKITDAGFESLSLSRAVESMQRYLSFVNDINSPVSNSMETSLWKYFSPEEANHFVELLCEFFITLAQKYFDLIANGDFGSEVFLTKINSRSNIANVSCFSALTVEMVLTVVLRNVASLSGNVKNQFCPENYPLLPTEKIAQRCVARYGEIFVYVRDMLANHSYQKFQSIIADHSAKLAENEQTSYSQEVLMDQTKVSKLCRFFLHYLVRLFGYLKTIHPSAVSTIFGLIVNQFVQAITNSSANVTLSYADAELILRLLGNSIDSKDRNLLEDFVSRLKLAEIEQQRAEVEINSYLDKNRFHFISFSG